MARTPITPVKAQANAKQHLKNSRAAIDVITYALAQGGEDASERIAAATKVLEAAGCYIRRQNDKGLLIP